MTAHIIRLPEQQPYFAEGSEALLALEGMVDRVGLRNLVYALSHICDARAVHIAETWQDVSRAKAWARDAAMLDNLAGRLERGVSF